MIIRLFKKYIRIDKTERMILNQTFLWFIYAFILVRFIPLRWFNSLLGEYKKETIVDLDKSHLDLVHLVKKNIRRWKRFLPWKVKCFEEAIVAKKILERYNIQTTLYLGVNKDNNNELNAHAWLKAGSKIITGEKGFERFVVVGFYS